MCRVILLEIHGGSRWVIDMSFFWINGEELSCDTRALFDYVRALPEPVPEDLILWNSTTSQLAHSFSEWSAVLVEALLTLIGSMYEHHDSIIAHFAFQRMEEDRSRPLEEEL